MKDTQAENALRKALQAALSVPNERAMIVGWQPIETAPKDEEILLWSEALEGPGQILHGALADCVPNCVTLINSHMSEYLPHENGEYLTHWMPLPIPPDAIERGDFIAGGGDANKETDHD